MYHPTRGGVRGGRDQFTWDDVKVDKHRENYLGHSIKAPVGRWQKGKDLHWYTRDKKSLATDMEAAKDEIKNIKEQEEQAMREALGLAPRSASRPQGNRLDKHEFSELVKRSSTAEDLGEGHSEAAWVQGLGFSRAPYGLEESSSVQRSVKDVSPEGVEAAMPKPSAKTSKKEELEDESNHMRRRPSKKEEPEDERDHKRRRREERKHERHEKHEKWNSQHSDNKRARRKDKEKRRHGSD